MHPVEPSLCAILENHKPILQCTWRFANPAVTLHVLGLDPLALCVNKDVKVQVCEISLPSIA